MRGEQIERFQEDNSTQQRDLNLNDVFNKITDIWHQQNSVSNVVLKPQLKLSSEVIESVLPETLNVNVGCGFFAADDNEDGGASQALARRLEDELRAAKTAHLSCGEVLLPADLLPRIARDVIRMAENEPCGLRGCTLFINFENEQECRKIGTIKCDPSTVSTFELYLTLKQDSSSWHSLLPQFLKNLTRGGTIMISRGFVLEKKKLYRSYREV